ncbi:MAG: hypothetical protein F6J93_07515 [Oscillatoria sp. SIO1A7]|nr:hypothetical protein [Oscillatoria sp. SIO1A7]
MVSVSTSESILSGFPYKLARSCGTFLNGTLKGIGHWALGIGQGDKGTRGQGDKGTRGQGDKGTRGQGDRETGGLDNVLLNPVKHSHNDFDLFVKYVAQSLAECSLLAIATSSFRWAIAQDLTLLGLTENIQVWCFVGAIPPRSHRQ